MNDLQRERIVQLRTGGASYNKIASALGISINTVKSFCRRNNLGGNLSIGVLKNIVSQIFCKQCGKELVQVPGRKALKFCSGDCRVKWWNARPDKVNKKAFYSFTCANCNVSFTAYGNSTRKYCSHQCYIHHRFKGGGLI